MSWAENEKLNEWIERAYENGKREEQERIIKLLVEADTTNLTTEELKGWYFSLALIKGKSQKDNENVVILTEGENE